MDWRLSYYMDINVNATLFTKIDLKVGNGKKPSIVAFPVARIEKIGQGSSATVYKSVLLRTLTVCAEKVHQIVSLLSRIYLSYSSAGGSSGRRI